MTITQFNAIKEYVLVKGDRRTYGNMYNNNPHLIFGTYHVYLNPSTGQANINCDSTLSDFDTLVIHDNASRLQYFHIKLKNDEQTLIFDPPSSTVYFDQLYLFVQSTKKTQT